MRRWIISFGAMFAFAVISVGAYAGLENIEFPVASLGNCESKDACFAYCGASEHQAACFEFARANGLMDEEDIAVVRQVKYGGGGPGGCESEDECEAYCDDPVNTNACFDFAVEHDLIPEEEQELVRDVLAGNGPGGCRTREECNIYCADPAHTEECIEFANRHGLIDEDDAEIARLVATVGGPGGCFNEESCRSYCDEPKHLEECVDFAVENNFMTAAEAEQALSTGGIGPGGCRGRECESYCDDPAHAEECIEFAVTHGFIEEEEAELARTVARSGGPGGCRGERECRVYCDAEGHEQECFDFGVVHGLIPPEEVEQIRKMINTGGPGGCRGRACKTYCEDPEHGEECLNFAIENDLMPLEEVDRARKGLEFMKRGGPGGCHGREACDAYCSKPDNQEACFNFAIENDLLPPEERERMEEFRAREGELVKIVEEQGGPGGCHSKSECMAYCGDSVNQTECNLFATQHGFTPPSLPNREGEEFNDKEFEGERFQFCSNPANRLECGERSRERSPFEESIRDETFQKEFKGPGQCSSPRECFDYCSTHKEECQSFQGQGIESHRAPCPLMPEFDCPAGSRKVYRHEDMCPVSECQSIEAVDRGWEYNSGEQSFGRPSQESSPPPFEESPLEFEGPGGCKTPQECASFCANNPAVCGVGGPAPGAEYQFGEMPLPPFSSPPATPPNFVTGNEPYAGFTPPENFNSGEFNPPPGFVPGQEFNGGEGFRSYEEYQPAEGFKYPEGSYGEGTLPTGGFTPPSDFVPPAGFSPPYGSEGSAPSFEAQSFSVNNISCNSSLNCLSACLAVANMRECRQMVKWYLMAKL